MLTSHAVGVSKDDIAYLTLRRTTHNDPTVATMGRQVRASVSSASEETRIWVSYVAAEGSKN